MKGEGGLKPCEGEKGAGERGNPRGERGAGGSKQTFIRMWLEYSNWKRRKQSKEENGKEEKKKKKKKRSCTHKPETSSQKKTAVTGL